MFDANVLLGPLRRQPPAAPQDVPGLLATLDSYGVGRALVTHTFAKWHHPTTDNRRLLEEIAGHPRLVPCWVVLPAATGEVPPEPEQVANLLAAGVRAARLCPAAHRLSLQPWEIEPLVAALAERRVPLLLDFDLGHWSEAKSERYRFAWWACRSYPELPLILLREPGTELRTLLPLLDACPNLHVETSYMQAHDGVAHGGAGGVGTTHDGVLLVAAEEPNVYLDLTSSVGHYGAFAAVVAAVGCHKLTYGSDTPWFCATHEIGRALLAPIPEEDKRRILGGTLAGLLATRR